MQPQKPMQKAELDLLAVIVRLHATRGPINRDVLSVEARGQGLEFGRALSVLRGHGLVEEVVKKPFFLSRLLGAKPIAQIRPTASGLALMAPAPVEPVAAPADLPAPPVPDTEIAPEASAEPVANPDSAPAVEAAMDPAPAEAPVEPAAPRPPPRRKPLPVNAYTDDLGGIPAEDVPLVPAFRVDPDIIDGLREMLDVIGMPMTFAGEALVADRMAKGAMAGDALMQLVLFGFAHAIRLESLTHGTLDLAGLAQYGAEVLAEMEKLHLADAISADRFAEDSALLRALVTGAEPDRALAESILADPVGGAAPPTLLPEDLRLPPEDIGEPTY